MFDFKNLSYHIRSKTIKPNYSWFFLYSSWVAVKFAQGYKIARRVTFARRHFCMRRDFYTKIFLYWLNIFVFIIFKILLFFILYLFSVTTNPYLWTLNYFFVNIHNIFYFLNFYKLVFNFYYYFHCYLWPLPSVSYLLFF